MSANDLFKENDKIVGKMKDSCANATSIISDEERVLKKAVKMTNGTLTKAYTIPCIDSKGVTSKNWLKADVWVQIQDKNLYLNLRYGSLEAHLLRIVKLDGAYFVNLLAVSWADCRNIVKLDEVLAAIAARVKRIRPQTTSKTEELLGEIATSVT